MQFSSLFHPLRRFTQRNTPSATPSVRLPDLILNARKLAQTLKNGQHGSRKAGQGEEFWQFRPHMPFEPASSIDWKQSARSPTPDTLWVRERERHTTQPLFLWADSSPSMRWKSPTAPSSKHDVALTDLLALAQAALHGGEYVGVLGKARRYQGTQNLPNLAYDLTHFAHPHADLKRLPSQAHVVIASDFLWPEKDIEALLQQCRERIGTTCLLGILDPQERDFSYSGHIRFHSVEDNTPLTLPAVDSLHESYQHILDRHLHRFAPSRSARNAAPIFQLHITNQEASPVLRVLHQRLGGQP